MKRVRDEPDTLLSTNNLPLDLFYTALFNTAILSALQRYLDTYDVFCLSAVTRRMYDVWTAHRDRVDALCLRQRLAMWCPPADCKNEHLFFWVRTRSLAFVLQSETKRVLPCWRCNRKGYGLFVCRVVFTRQTCGPCAIKCFRNSDRDIYPSTGFEAAKRTPSTIFDVRPFKGCIPICYVRDYACRYYKMTRRVYFELGIPEAAWERVVRPFYQGFPLKRDLVYNLVPAKYVEDTVWTYMNRRAREECQKGVGK